MIDTLKMGHQSEMPVGNEAKLRETLVAVKKSIDEIGASSLDGDPEILMMSLTQVCARLSARIDAALAAPATSEKSSVVGDAAKLREALEAIDRNTGLLDIAENIAPKLHPSHSFVAVQIRKIIRAALSAPPRNCDRFSSESEMRAAFIDWYNEVYDLKRSKYAIDTGNLKHDVDGILHDYIKWLLAPAMERKGGAK